MVLLALALIPLAGCGTVPDPDPTVVLPTPTTTTTAPPPTTPVAAPCPLGPVRCPDPSVTPGLPLLPTQPGDVCTPGWAGRHRHGLTPAQKRTVLAAYHAPADARVFEWDHLVSLELGGGNGPRNVWPMRDDADQQRKDRLEDRLHREVCAGRLDLAAAQARIRQFWRWW